MTQTSTNTGYQWKKIGDAAPPSFPGYEPAPSQPLDNEYQRGYEEGHAEGYAAGQALAASEAQQLQSALGQLIDETERLRQRTVTECLRDMSVALQRLFASVFKHELRTNPALVEAMADEIVLLLHEQAKPKLMLNPQDHNALYPRCDETLQHILFAEEGLPAGVVRASAGQSMIELDVVANLDQILAEWITRGGVEFAEPAQTDHDEV